MLNNEDFLSQTLVNNMFYLRTLREFCICIQLSFLAKNDHYIIIAKELGEKAEELGEEYLKYADGNISQLELDSDFIVTPYTLPAEKMTERLFEITLATKLTEKELEIKPGIPNNVSDAEVEELNALNKKTLALVKNFITFVTELYELETDNKLFSFTYPHLLKYMIESADSYQKSLRRLIGMQNVDPTYVVNFEYSFIVTLMDTAIYIRSFVNPTAIDVFIKAQSYVAEFGALLEEFKAIGLTPENQQELSLRTIKIVERYSEFLASVLERVLAGELYFIVEPIFLDNMYTEANYFLYVIKKLKKEQENQ